MHPKQKQPITFYDFINLDCKKSCDLELFLIRNKEHPKNFIKRMRHIIFWYAIFIQYDGTPLFSHLSKLQ